MTSNSNIDVKRSVQKTHSAFNALPTLRSKDRRESEKSTNRRFKRPPQFADQLLFPGRRLDRLHRSTYSGYSGRSLDIETIVSGGAGIGGRLNSAEVNSTIGSGKSGSLVANGFSRSLNDVTNQPWDSMRQLPSAHSHLSLVSRQGNKLLSAASGASRHRGIGNTFSGASASMGNLNASTHEVNNNNISGGYPVPTNKWQFSGGNHKFFQEKVFRDSTSPDSSYSSDSVSEDEPLAPPLPILSTAMPVPSIKLQRQNSNLSKNRTSRKPSRRPSDNTNTSSTPQLDKILWALVPDEFANISDTGVSDLDLDRSVPETNTSRYVTFTDLEAADLDSRGENGVGMATSRIPDTPRRPILTQETLSQYGKTVPNDDRIMHWLADCEAHTLSTSLPTHLPDISYTFKFANSKS